MTQVVTPAAYATGYTSVTTKFETGREQFTAFYPCAAFASDCILTAHLYYAWGMHGILPGARDSMFSVQVCSFDSTLMTTRQSLILSLSEACLSLCACTSLAALQAAHMPYQSHASSHGLPVPQVLSLPQAGQAHRVDVRHQRRQRWGTACRAPSGRAPTTSPHASGLQVDDLFLATEEPFVTTNSYRMTAADSKALATFAANVPAMPAGSSFRVTASLCRP